MTQDITVPFKINIPLGLKDRLSEAASRSGRSLTSEIITRLEASIEISDVGGLDFTPEALAEYVAKEIEIHLDEFRDRLTAIEAMAAGRDPYNREG